ncbi:hypothetical protein BDQ12DRAFT_692251 [Crucibulum laeve]|uniref:FAD-binding domain-containing protein n=1 Tax=Crucibulum laeve TaxID=68775 RepID=A0A5C3LIL4_9AGAR|nr:hypothetical protein BDQ12DRAFT_692251 [Crucibulum laeve]
MSFQSLSFVIIGGGITGLSTGIQLARAGHSVVVLESSPCVSETGAGIQLMPNAARILYKLGSREYLEEFAVRPHGLVVRRYVNGEVLSQLDFDGAVERYGIPFYNIHRRHLIQHLFDLAIQSKVHVRFNATVSSIELGGTAPSITLTSGEEIAGDVLIGADGVHSVARRFLAGNIAEMTTITGDAAYRAVVPVEKLLSDPDLAPLITTPEVTCWLGPGRHVVGYCISGRTEYNIVLVTHPDVGSAESWKLEGSADVMRNDFADWDPSVTKILKLVDKTYRWKLIDREPLKSWHDPSGRLILIGDACHPLLPYRAQGAAMGIEDAAVLGELFSRISSIHELPVLASAFQKLRSPRCEQAQQASRANQHIFHLPDGPMQLARDDRLKESFISEAERKAIFEYDPAAEVAAWREGETQNRVLTSPSVQ